MPGVSTPLTPYVDLCPCAIALGRQNRVREPVAKWFAPSQKQVTACPTSPPPVISVWFERPGQSRVVGRLRRQSPSFVSQPVHFSGAASLHCAQHHVSSWTTSFNGNGRHRATTASASAITTPTPRSHIHFRRIWISPNRASEKVTSRGNGCSVRVSRCQDYQGASKVPGISLLTSSFAPSQPPSVAAVKSVRTSISCFMALSAG